MFKTQITGRQILSSSIVSTNLTSSLSISGTMSAEQGFSGSLTRLSSGLSYLVAGTNVSIVSASNGQVTISSTATSSGSGGGGDPNASYVVLSATASLANERALTAGTGIIIADGGAGSTVTISATGVSGTYPLNILSVPFLAGLCSTGNDSTSKQSLGCIYFDPAWHGSGTRTYKFRSILETTDINLTAYVDIYDLSGIVLGTPIGLTGSIINTNALIPTQVSASVSGIFTTVTGSGILEARLWLGSASSTNQATCKGAWLDILW
jgi:hypothetical protein